MSGYGWSLTRSVLGDPDLVVLPGTKTTVADLSWLRATGLADSIAAIAGSGREKEPLVLGICGGYQMLGNTISDRDGVEGVADDVDGLAWLPVETSFGAEKVVRRSRGVLALVEAPESIGEPVEGYEIHHGITEAVGDPGCAAPWIRFGDDTAGGREQEGMADLKTGVLGTSLHGLLENDGAAKGDPSARRTTQRAPVRAF